MSKILRYLACLFMLIFVGNALAAGYSCPTYKKYTSCNEGFYISNCGTSSSGWNGQYVFATALAPGNSCNICPSGYECDGGLRCPKSSSVTITLNKNGGSGTCGGTSSTTAGSVSCTPGSSCTLPSWNSSTCSMTNGNKIFKGWSTSSTATSGVTTITPSAAATYYAVWVTPTCSATNGSCSITTPSSNAPRATITCNTGYSQSGGTNTTTSFTVTGSVGATTVSGACSARSYTCSAGQYLNGATCTSCTSPYYCIGGTWTYNGGAQGRSSCSSLSGVSPSGGTYSSVSPYNASTTCRYKAPSKTITGCSTVTSNTVSYNGSAWPASTYAVTARGGYIISGNNTSSATCTQCGAGKYSAGGSATSCSTCANWTYSSAGASSCTACLDVESGWTKASGTGWTSYASCKETKTGTAISGYCTAGVLTKAQSSASAWGSASITTALKAEAGAYVNGQTCSRCSAGTYQGTDGSTATSCSVCSTNTYSNAGAASCTSCNTTKGYGNSGTTASSHAGVASCKVTCDAGEYVPTAGGGCVSVGSGYYTTSSIRVAQNATSTSRSSCSSLSGVSPSGGTYSSVSPYNASTTCRYKAPSKTITGCSTVTSNTVSYNGSAWPASTYAVTARGGYIISGNNTSSATCTQCGAGKYSAGGSATSCSTCANWTYSSAGASSCTACLDVESGWTKASGTGWTSYASCKETKTGTAISGYCTAGVLTKAQSSASAWGSASITTALKAEAGAYVNGQTCSRCSAGTYQGTDGSTATSCSACSGRTKYSLAGASACSTVSAGYYTTGCDTSGNKCTNQSACGGNAYYCSGGVRNNVSSGYYSTGGTETTRTGQSQCTGATYCSGGVKNNCPTNYDDETTTAGKTSASQCKISCSGGYRVTSANAACSAITSGNVYIGAHSVAYGSTSPAATSCPASYTISGTTAADHDAKSDCKISCSAGTQVVSADAACTTPDGSWYTGTHTVSAGSTSGTNVKSCVSGYATADTTTKTDHDASTDCKISCSAGTRVVSANAACTTPSGNWYVGAHSVAQGSTSSVNSCLTNYTITGTAATNHDAASDCKISCSGGAYIAAANDTSCEDVGAGYWAAASTVSQGSAGVRNACDAGLTTIGSGAGADEAGDCGRVLNVNGEKIYLRSDKKTTPSLNVSISGKTFYGNMGTSTVGSLKIKSSGTTYSVYDDSMK